MKQLLTVEVSVDDVSLMTIVIAASYLLVQKQPILVLKTKMKN
jgi:hypothetical protein